MTEGKVDVVSRDAVTIITINRAAKRNAMSATMCDELRRA